jgi:hypothetical protein
MKKKPNIGTMSAYELIAMLDAQYKHSCIAVGEHETMAHRRAGARELVDGLLNRKEREENGNRPTTISV